MFTDARNHLIQDKSVGTNGSWGIYNKNVDESCREAFNLIQVIRHEFWKLNPNKSSSTVDSSVNSWIKNKINVNTFLNKYLSKEGVKMVSKLNNKIIVQNQEDINLFVLKSDNDALRFIESLTERFVKLKRGDCMFVNDSSGPQKKYLRKLKRKI